MLTSELRGKIDAVWNAFWSGGVSNPLEVIEQITNLLFIRGLDDIETREENKANLLGKPQDRRIFPEGKDGIERKGGLGEGEGGVDYQRLRWSRFRNDAPGTMYEIVGEHVFPFIRRMAGSDTAVVTRSKVHVGAASALAIGIAVFITIEAGILPWTFTDLAADAVPVLIAG